MTLTWSGGQKQTGCRGRSVSFVSGGSSSSACSWGKSLQLEPRLGQIVRFKTKLPKSLCMLHIYPVLWHRVISAQLRKKVLICTNLHNPTPCSIFGDVSTLFLHLFVSLFHFFLTFITLPCFLFVLSLHSQEEFHWGRHEDKRFASLKSKLPFAGGCAVPPSQVQRLSSCWGEWHC